MRNFTFIHKAITRSPTLNRLIKPRTGVKRVHQLLVHVKAPEVVAYPRCIGEARTCPLEDCGGTRGYQRLQEILSDPEHPETRRWAGGSCDPERFDPAAIKFDNPKTWWRIAFRE